MFTFWYLPHPPSPLYLILKTQELAQDLFKIGKTKELAARFACVHRNVYCLCLGNDGVQCGCAQGWMSQALSCSARIGRSETAAEVKAAARRMGPRTEILKRASRVDLRLHVVIGSGCRIAG
jgi:hypothetical protein